MPGRSWVAGIDIAGTAPYTDLLRNDLRLAEANDKGDGSHQRR